MYNTISESIVLKVFCQWERSIRPLPLPHTHHHIVRSDGVFMSRLVDRGGPGRQEIILNCVLQIQKYKVGENILK